MKAAILFLTLATAVLAYQFFFKRSSFTDFDLSNSQYSVGDGVNFDWNRMCISSEYRVPSRDIENSPNCVHDGEVPEYSVYITYMGASDQCNTHRLSGSFLFNHNSETRCFSHDEVAGEYLKLENRVIEFGE